MKKIIFLLVVFCISIGAFGQYTPLYKKAISITNDGSESFTNYPVYLKINTAELISAGYMQSDGDDIRFSSDLCSSSTFYDYYIENYINTDSTIIWVKLPLYNSMTTYTIYMYYGDALCSSASNFNNTFVNRYISSGNFTITGTNNYDWLQINSGDTLFIGAGDSTLIINSKYFVNNGVIYGKGRGYQVSNTLNSIGTGPGGGQISIKSNSGSGGAGYGGNGGRVL